MKQAIRAPTPPAWPAAVVVVIASCTTIDPGLRLVNHKGTELCEVPEPVASVRMSGQYRCANRRQGLVVGDGVRGRDFASCRGACSDVSYVPGGLISWLNWVEPVWVSTGMALPLISTVGVPNDGPLGVCCDTAGLLSAAASWVFT